MFNGMASLYKTNPHKRRAAITAKVAENAGFAAPLLYASLGNDIKQAEGYDAEISGQIKTYMDSRAKLENAKFAKENEKNIQDTMSWAMDTGKKIWQATPGSPELKSKAVTTMINDRLVSAGVPPMKAVSFDEHGQVSFAMVVGENEDGSLNVRNGRILANGVLEVQEGVDEKQQPVFKPAGPGETTLEKFKGMKDLRKMDEPKNDFDLYQKAKKAEGWTDAQISEGWEARKVKIAKESKITIPKEEGRTSDMKELDIINSDRKKAGQPELSLEEYKKQKFEMNDPYGVKAQVKEKLTKGKTGSPPAAPVVAKPPAAPVVAKPPAANAKQAPDGNWYVPDPKRPGKYLRVD